MATIQWQAGCRAGGDDVRCETYPTWEQAHAVLAEVVAEHLVDAIDENDGFIVRQLEQVADDVTDAAPEQEHEFEAGEFTYFIEGVTA